MIFNPNGTVHDMGMGFSEKELCVLRFLANLLVFYIVDGPKGDLIICCNVLTLICKDHVNIHAALN